VIKGSAILASINVHFDIQGIEYPLYIEWLIRIEFMFLAYLESSQRGVHALGSMIFGLAVQKFLNIDFFTEKYIKS